MNYSTYETPALLPRAAVLWVIVGFLIAAVWVARFRPAWLLRVWLGAYLLALGAALLATSPRYLRDAPVLVVAELALGIAIPTGLTTVWLHHSRRHAARSRTAVQLAGALAVFTCGLMIVAIFAGLAYAAAG